MQLSSSSKTVIDDAILRFVERYGVPDLDISITKGRGIIFEKGFSLFGLKDNSDENGIYMLSSVVKTITAFAVVKASENHDLDLNCRVLI
ncbi:serine hydrolase [Sessilibacter corallicola]|uniref:serine hydrolase n=1 Tax=Sessilibacter corallicola TaxID=2904075 RepID=UPI001E2DC83C|nr:serine hydrolase [Sessilibacter corallicola]MCE2029446.1 serine hydrolase [Sessilibacter corallicola]